MVTNFILLFSGVSLLWRQQRNIPMTERAMASISLEHVVRSFGNQTVLNDISLEIADGEFLVLLGPSGCGKSTLLRTIAGLEQPSSGRVYLDGEDVTQAQPGERDIGMVFQNYSLYPHLSVKENLAFGLRARRTPRHEVDAAVGRVASLLELQELLARKPRQLSGGQRQRVALGRAIARRPRVILMDEPLSNLDSALRDRMRVQLRRLHQKVGLTTLYVTHDQQEALALADRVAVMRAGSIEQVGPPEEVLLRPATAFTAAFVGSPPMNLIHIPDPGSEAEQEITIGIRPEDLILGALSGPSISLEVSVEVLERTRDGLLLHGLWRDREVVAKLPLEADRPAAGSITTLSASIDHLAYFCPDSGRRLDLPHSERAKTLAAAQCS